LQAQLVVLVVAHRRKPEGVRQRFAGCRQGRADKNGDCIIVALATLIAMVRGS